LGPGDEEGDVVVVLREAQGLEERPADFLRRPTRLVSALEQGLEALSGVGHTPYLPVWVVGGVEAGGDGVPEAAGDLVEVAEDLVGGRSYQSPPTSLVAWAGW
jgi:hypothetical protein